MKFMWKNIVTRFGVPRVLISNNGLQFDNKAFQLYCMDLGLQIDILHHLIPKAMVRLKRPKAIVNGLKKKQDNLKGQWAKELPSVLWAYRTTPRRSTR